MHNERFLISLIIHEYHGTKMHVRHLFSSLFYYDVVPYLNNLVKLTFTVFLTFASLTVF